LLAPVVAPGGRLVLDRDNPAEALRYCNRGDGSVIMPRSFGDVYFSQHRSFEDCGIFDTRDDARKCSAATPSNTTQLVMEDLPHLATSKDGYGYLHMHRYGLVGSHGLTECQEALVAWFRRPTLEPEYYADAALSKKDNATPPPPLA